MDGLDRLGGEDSRRFFVEDVYQLKLVEANFIYCAPIHRLYQDNRIQQSFRHFILPMIKLIEADGKTQAPEGLQTMREMVVRRVDLALFDSPDTMDYLIGFSGGNPRELMKLLDYTFQDAHSDKLDRAAAEMAVKRLASDYSRLLSPDDYLLLRRIDRMGKAGEGDAERVRCLLYNLALLEYNDYFRRSHPIVRTLDLYQRADRAAKHRLPRAQAK